jgi:hypothetical protein
MWCLSDLFFIQVDSVKFVLYLLFFFSFAWMVQLVKNMRVSEKKIICISFSLQVEVPWLEQFVGQPNKNHLL